MHILLWIISRVINTPEFQWLHTCKFVFCSRVTVLCRCSWLADLLLSSVWYLRDPDSLYLCMVPPFFRALEPCMLLTGLLRTPRLKVTNICPHLIGEKLSQSLIGMQGRWECSPQMVDSLGHFMMLF